MRRAARQPTNALGGRADVHNLGAPLLVPLMLIRDNQVAHPLVANANACDLDCFLSSRADRQTSWLTHDFPFSKPRHTARHHATHFSTPWSRLNLFIHTAIILRAANSPHATSPRRSLQRSQPQHTTQPKRHCLPPQKPQCPHHPASSGGAGGGKPRHTPQTKRPHLRDV
jgi:hypothetical protein